MVEGAPFPVAESTGEDDTHDVPLTRALANADNPPTFADYMHLGSGIVAGSDFIACTIELHRSGSSAPSLAKFDLTSGKLVGLERPSGMRGCTSVAFALSGDSLLAFTEEKLLRVDRRTLTLTDQAPNPKGFHFVGGDAERLIFHHKRTNTVTVAQTRALDDTLSKSVPALAAEMTAAIAANKPSAKARSSRSKSS